MQISYSERLIALVIEVICVTPLSSKLRIVGYSGNFGLDIIILQQVLTLWNGRIGLGCSFLLKKIYVIVGELGGRGWNHKE